jgi:hypothetical protein
MAALHYCLDGDCVQGRRRRCSGPILRLHPVAAEESCFAGGMSDYRNLLFRPQVRMALFAG